MRLARLLLLVAIAFAGVATASTEAAWSALRGGGHVLIIRHGLTTTGVGDPPGFVLEDCTTQRNLSEEGRAQSRAMGERIRATGATVGDVLSSRWCRCLETARLAFGRVTPWPPLDSQFGRAGPRGDTAAVRERIATWRGPGTLVMVTHQVNISALMGEGAAMGEALVLAPGGTGGPRLVGRIPF